MATIRQLSPLFLIPLFLFLRPIDAQVVDVSIQTDKTRFEVGEALPVTVILRARGDSSVVLYDGGVNPQPIPGQPISVLAFDIHDSAGKRIERQPEQNSIILKKPSYCNFRELSPRSFEGTSYYINIFPFSYKLEAPGRYRIRAKWTFLALEWLRDFNKETTADGFKKNFSEELLATGTVESNEIEIEIAGSE